MDNFANHPLSIAEIKSDKTDNPIDWSPRDALISALRDIDSGKISPESLVIIYNTTDDPERACFYNATKGPVTLRGIILYFITNFLK